jgi:predicted RNase H-like HicB family nuclease
MVEEVVANTREKIECCHELVVESGEAVPEPISLLIMAKVAV